MADQAHAVVYLTEYPAPSLVEALTIPMPEWEGQHFTRVCGNGADTNDAGFSTLAGSAAVWSPDVFVLSGERVSVESIHEHLSGLPWTGSEGGIAIIDTADHKVKMQVKIYGRLAR